MPDPRTRSHSGDLAQAGYPIPFRVELTSSLNQGGSAKARILEPTGPGGAMQTSGEAFDVHDSLSRFAGEPPAKFWAIRKLDSRKIELLGPGEGGESNEPQLFELTGTLSAGGTATANLLVWDAGADDYVTAGDPITVRDFTETPGAFAGIAGYRGLAVLKDDRGDYVIVFMEQQAKWILFTLIENIGATNPNRASATVTGSWHGKNPGATVTVWDDQELFTRALSGAEGFAVWDDVTLQYQIVECETKAGAIRFTLTANFGSGSSATATVNDFSGTQQDVQNPGASVTVYDDAGVWPRAIAGCQGEAILDIIDDKYRIVAMQHKAKKIRFALGGTLTTSTASVASCTVENFWDGIDPGATVTVMNLETAVADTYVFFGPGLAIGLAEYDEVIDIYRIYQMECS